MLGEFFGTGIGVIFTVLRHVVAHVINARRDVRAVVQKTVALLISFFVLHVLRTWHQSSLRKAEVILVHRVADTTVDRRLAAVSITIRMMFEVEKRHVIHRRGNADRAPCQLRTRIRHKGAKNWIGVLGQYHVQRDSLAGIERRVQLSHGRILFPKSDASRKARLLAVDRQIRKLSFRRARGSVL